MGSYTAVLKRPGVTRILLSQLAARWAFGMMSLAFVLHVQKVTNSYAIAGITLGAETLGAAIAGPLMGYLIPRLGARPIIFTTATVGSAAMVLLGFNDGKLPAIMVALGFIVGLSSPPVQQIVRPIYPSLITKGQTNHLFALDANMQELIWVVGPILATFIAANAGTSTAVYSMAAVQIAGCYLFASNHEVRTTKLEPSKRRLGGVLKSRVVIANVAMGLLLVASFGGAEVGTVAVITDRNVSGIVLAALSAGSLIGGFAFGHRAKTKYALSKYFALITFGFALVFLAPSNPFWVSVCWFVAGLGVAPIFAGLASIIAIRLSPSESVEAYGWIGTGQLIGFSSAAAIAGIAVDTIAPIAAFGVSVVTGILGLVVALISLPVTPAPPKTDKADH